MSTNEDVFIGDIDKVMLLEALWYKQKPAAFYAFNMVQSPHFDKVLASKAIETYIDYYCGRCIKMDIHNDTVNPYAFDRDAGVGAFQQVVDQLRNNIKPIDIVIMI
jgi:hypothetical protein